MRSLVIFVALSTIVVEINTIAIITPICRINEQYLKCVSSACQDLPCFQSPPFHCPNDCVTGCFCLPGFARNKLGQCVSCEPPKPVCPKNEIWSDCISPCASTYCNQTIALADGAAAKCITVCKGSGCVCVAGLKRNQCGLCVKC